MTEPNDSKPRIFLCYASEDKPRVAELYHQLRAVGYHPWLDKYDLLPGQDWRQEIEKIISDLDNLIVVCLSQKSITKRGVVQQEITWALDVFDQMPEDTIYLIPARLEPCQPPRRLSKLHWVDLFEPGGFDHLKRALDAEIRKHRPSFLPELIHIPAGEFLMGSDPSVDKDAREDEQPQHRLYLPDYYIAKTPVTNAQYAAFLQATDYQRQSDRWKSGQPPAEKEDHPVVNVSWYDAMAHCQWLTETTARTYRLPTEAEWEKAARGPDGRIYPWGNQWDVSRCNTNSLALDTTSVGSYPDGASPYGLLDMAGNVLEWCATKDGKPYPYDVTEDERSIDYLAGDEFRVLRGGSFFFYPSSARCAARHRNGPNYYYNDYGFRIVASPRGG